MPIRSLRGQKQGAVLYSDVRNSDSFQAPVLSNFATHDDSGLKRDKVLMQYAIWRSSSHPLRVVAAAFMEPRDTTALESMEECSFSFCHFFLCPFS